MEQSFESSYSEVRLSSSPLLRAQEKEEFQQLNDRLAAYIERIRALKGTNLSLETEITVLKTDITSAAKRVKDSFDAKLAHKRALIDKTAKEKARQQLLAQNYSSDNSKLRREVDDLEKRIEEIERRVTSSNQRCNTIEEKYRATIQERERLHASLKENGKELDSLKAQLERLKKLLEDETVERVDLHNRIMSLNEEVAFIKKKHAAELASLRTAEFNLDISRGQIKRDVVEQVDGQLESAIRELQQQSKQECDLFKLELNAAFEDKLAKLEMQSGRDSETVGSLTMELRESSDANATSSRELEKLRAMVARLERLWKEKEAELAQVKLEWKSETDRLRDELISLRASYEEKMKAYKDLFDLKIKLDQELETYRQLLEAEENRLHLKFRKRTRPSGGSPSPVRPKRFVEQHTVNAANISSTATGNVYIINVDPKGKYVQIKNMADQPESVGGFKLTHSVAGSGQEDTFVFHARSRLKGGSTTTVWSKLSGEEHQPPSDIVSKQINMWGVGGVTTTHLYSNKGELIATYIQRQELSSAIHVTSTPEVQQQQQETVTDGPGPSHLTQDEESGGEGEGEEVQVGTEDLYRQQEEEEEEAQVEKKNRSCVIS